MTWLPLLLADRSFILRRLVLTDLLERNKDDSEVHELDQLLEEDPRVKSLLKLQNEDGSWHELDFAGHSIGGSIRATSAALIRLGYFKFNRDHPAVRKGVEYLFKEQNDDGSWPLSERVSGKDGSKGPYDMTPVQTSVPLQAIAMCGYPEDPHSENAYEWLFAHQNEDGTWPAGKVGDVFVRIAGYRKLPHSRWGCRTNTTQSLLCLVHHPKLQKSTEARDALDHLLGRETRERHNLGFSVARYIGIEPYRGALTFHAKFDPALVLDLCARIGASITDDRVRDLVDWVRGQQGEYGLWEYIDRPEASRWVSFDLLRSLVRINEETEWISTKPRRHFTPYPTKKKRF